MVEHVAILVPRRQVKTVKTALETQNKYRSSTKIKYDEAHGACVVPTTFEPHESGEIAALLAPIGLKDVRLVPLSAPDDTNPPRSRLGTIVRDWLSSRNTSTLEESLSTGYSVYGPLLLLPSSATAWSETEPSLLTHVAHHLPCTHIALNAPIDDEIIRSPTNLRPLYGDFGPVCTGPPRERDFMAAFWTHAKQNGIIQVWAPRHTMFSRGNVSEKQRILRMPGVVSAVRDGRQDKGCAVVDLFAGVGYFAFSYLAAGVDTVLCWDINPWSIEGLKRGAKANKFSDRVLVFNDNNTNALDVVSRLRDSIPPVRHVNCGLLPTSRDSWKIAVEVLDPQLGGWIHVHENFGIDEKDTRAENVRFDISRLVDGTREVRLEHVQRVKSFAPGVVHCVMDVYII